MKGFLKSLLASFAGSLLALAIGSFIIVAIIGGIISLASISKVSVPDSTILKINLGDKISDRYQQDPMGEFDPMTMQVKNISGMDIYNALKAIEAAADDSSVKFIFINAKECNSGITELEALRNALKSFRENSEKPVVAYLDQITSPSQYYVASVADKIYMNNDGLSMLFGLGGELFFLKDFLDEAGIEMQFIRHGKYKSAGEMFAANKISDANREQNERMLNSIWETMAEDVAASRDITAERFSSLVHNLKLTKAGTLLDNKLIDEVVTISELEEKLCLLFGVEKVKDLNFTSLGDYASAKVTNNIKAKERIAVVYAEGQIAVGGNGISSDELVPILNGLKRDDKVKAVVLRVNSPGGDAHAAELIRQSIVELKAEKPVIVSMGSYAASGGYWISADATKIYAQKSTLTGSIGVFSMIPCVEKIKNRLKINSTIVGTGPHAGFGTATIRLDEAQTAYLTDMVEDVYDRFTSIVAKGRDMSVPAVDSIAQGRVWSGADALGIKLVDEIGSLTDAIEYAASLAELESYKIVELPEQESSLTLLMKRFGVASAAAQKIADVAENPAEEVVKSLTDALKGDGTKVFARVPYIYNFNF